MVAQLGVLTEIVTQYRAVAFVLSCHAGLPCVFDGAVDSKDTQTSQTAGVTSRRSLIPGNQFIVRFAGHHPLGRHRPVGRHLVFRAHAVGVHLPVSRDLAAGHRVVREHQVYLVRLDSVVLPYYLSLLYY